MTADSLAGLSDHVGTLRPVTEEQEALVLRMALRVTGSADVVASLADMLGIGSAVAAEWNRP